MSSIDAFDGFRARFPDLSCSLYGMEPGGPVTFEVITETGQSFSFTGPTAAAAVASALPPEPAAPAEGVSSIEPLLPTPADDVFG